MHRWFKWLVLTGGIIYTVVILSILTNGNGHNHI